MIMKRITAIVQTIEHGEKVHATNTDCLIDKAFGLFPARWIGLFDILLFSNQ